MKKFIAMLALSLTVFGAVNAYSVYAEAAGGAQEQKIIKEYKANVSGDEREEDIILSGTKGSDTPFYENIKITVSEQKTGKTLYTITPTVNYGYDPDLLIADFTGNGVNEIFYGATSGGSGGFGYFYLYGTDGAVKTLFDFQTAISPYTAKYENFYKVKVAGGKKVFIIDISLRGKDYLDKLYKNGRLIKKTNADISAVNYVVPQFNSSTGIFSLNVIRRITGLYSADLLGYLNEEYNFTPENAGGGRYSVTI